MFIAHLTTSGIFRAVYGENKIHICHKDPDIKARYVNFLVQSAYFLQSWLPYRRTKQFVYNLLENDSYRYKKYFDYFMIAIILSSVTILVTDVTQKLPRWLIGYDRYIVTTIFICEYLLRMWVYSDIHKRVIEAYEEHLLFDSPLSLRALAWRILRDKWRYITTPSAIIDLIALLPSYREIRILRVFILFRVFKMLRYTRSLSSFLLILKYKKTELFTLLSLTTFFVFISGIMLYVFEGHDNTNIHSIFDAFYWSLVTISTVGYGDIAPVTSEGRAISMMIIVTGVGLISFITSVIVSAFGEQLTALKEENLVHDMGKKDQIMILCGFGTMGKLVAEGLRRQQITFVVIDKSQKAVEQAQALGYHALCSDATQSDIFHKLHIEHRISHLLALSSDDTQNALIAINVKSLNPNVSVTARCKDNLIAEKMRFANIDDIITPEEIGGKIGAAFATNPIASEIACSMIDQQQTRTGIEDLVIREESRFANKTIREIDFDTYKLTLLGILRLRNRDEEQFIFNPPEDFLVRPDDHLVCIGYDFALAKLRKESEKVAA